MLEGRFALAAGTGWLLLPLILAPLGGCGTAHPIAASPTTGQAVAAKAGVAAPPRGDRHPAITRAAAPSHRSGEVGEASWYGEAFAGLPTASGEPFDPEAMTAAHPELPFGTAVTVLNLENGRSVDVVINDRGPFIAERIIDLSRAAARLLGFLRDGITRVQVVPAKGA